MMAVFQGDPNAICLHGDDCVDKEEDGNCELCVRERRTWQETIDFPYYDVLPTPDQIEHALEGGAEHTDPHPTLTSLPQRNIQATNPTTVNPEVEQPYTGAQILG
jgi:hypothetical protein